jgi:5-methylcytosine-specific restriction enzyme subunit McrC
LKTLRTIRLREHETLRGVRLNADEHSELERCGARLVIRSSGRGTYDVGAAEVVGAVSTAHLHVVIEPKVKVGRLLALLAYATRPVEFRSSVAADERRDLLSIMQEVYAAALEDTLRRGLVHAYEPRTDRLHAVRGRIEIEELALRRFGVFPPIDCAFDEHTADVEVNRRLLAAALHLARHDRGSAAARRLVALAARMADVAEITYSASTLVPLQLDRRFDHARTALSLAEIVLRHASIELAGGVAESLGFLIDMDRLFEDVVVEGLRSRVGSHLAWTRQPAGMYLDESGHVPIRPDVVARRRSDGRVVLVLDVKYKATTLAKNQDLYQLIAYSQAVGATRAALVYATVEYERLRVRGGGPEVELHQLDLDCEPGELERRLAVLATTVRALASA